MRSKANTRIASVRGSLAAAREAMIHCSPEEIEHAEVGLVEAIQTLTKLERSLDGVSAPAAPSEDERADLLREMKAFQADLLRLSTLAGCGLEFCRNWSNAVQSAAGYLPNGESAAAGSSSTITIQG